MAVVKSSLASNRVLYITDEASLSPELRRPYHVFTFNGNPCIDAEETPFPRVIFSSSTHARIAAVTLALCLSA